MSDVAALFTWVNMRFLLQGLGLPLFISALAIACSVVLGTVISVMRTSRLRVLSGIATAYIEVFKNTPLLLWIMFTFFVAQLPPIGAAVLAFTLFTSASVAEIVRGGLASVPHGPVSYTHLAHGSVPDSTPKGEADGATSSYPRARFAQDLQAFRKAAPIGAQSRAHEDSRGRPVVSGAGRRGIRPARSQRLSLIHICCARRGKAAAYHEAEQDAWQAHVEEELSLIHISCSATTRARSATRASIGRIPFFPGRLARRSTRKAARTCPSPRRCRCAPARTMASI